MRVSTLLEQFRLARQALIQYPGKTPDSFRVSPRRNASLSKDTLFRRAFDVISQASKMGDFFVFKRSKKERNGSTLTRAFELSEFS